LRPEVGLRQEAIPLRSFILALSNFHLLSFINRKHAMPVLNLSFLLAVPWLAEG
jgi:hypothetical protein